jgi:hypothetical protein
MGQLKRMCACQAQRVDAASTPRCTVHPNTLDASTSAIHVPVATLVRQRARRVQHALEERRKCGKFAGMGNGVRKQRGASCATFLHDALAQCAPKTFFNKEIVSCSVKNVPQSISRYRRAILRRRGACF